MSDGQPRDRKPRSFRSQSARGRFRPTLWATICAALAIAVLLGLGTWQLQRLQWKQELIAERESRSQGPAVPLPADLGDPSALAYTRVALTGHFLNNRELYFGAKTHRGAVGLHVVTPFVLSDGRSILVDRGWVPLNWGDPETRLPAQIFGEVTIEAILRPGGWAGFGFTRPANDPVKNLWLWPDLPAMAAQAGLDTAVTAVYAVALPMPEQDSELPIALEPQIDLPNNHLSYAITWYALAVALLVIYLIFSTRRRPKRRRVRRSRPSE
jgi:surfeit locus 1 family protein